MRNLYASFILFKKKIESSSTPPPLCNILIQIGDIESYSPTPITLFLSRPNMIAISPEEASLLIFWILFVKIHGCPFFTLRSPTAVSFTASLFGFIFMEGKILIS